MHECAEFISKSHDVETRRVSHSSCARSPALAASKTVARRERNTRAVIPTYAPITLRAVDAEGVKRFGATAPFEWKIDIKELMEWAFVLAQTAALPDALL